MDVDAEEGSGTTIPAPVRLNRYLAAAGLGSRREVEGYLRAGQVTVGGEPVQDPSRRVHLGEEVRLNGTIVAAKPSAAVVLHKPAGSAAVLVHPPGLVPALPLAQDEAGLELLLGDPGLAARIADPRFPVAVTRRAGRRTRLAGVDLGDLPVGEWRPLAPRDLEALRRSVRLPPRP